MSRIVVGIDGSHGSRVALRWAVAEAKLRGAALEAIFVYSSTPDVALPAVVYPSPPPLEMRTAAAHELAHIVVAEANGLPVEQRAVDGHPVKVLVEAAEGAELLVVGTRGRGGFASLLLGSVSSRCAHLASCPVVIVPTPLHEGKSGETA